MASPLGSPPFYTPPSALPQSISGSFSSSRFFIAPHPLAPHVSSRSDAQAFILDLIKEVESPNFHASEKILQLVREVGFVNLWFFLKYIAGFSGPYNLINDTLHLDMANFRQSKYCMDPGARAAAFLGRSHFKSTVLTHGADTWEILRNPNIRIRIVNAIYEKAEQFAKTIKDTFTNNELFAACYPEYVIKRNQAAIIVPCRTRYYPEPNVKVGGVGGAAAGDHHDLIDLDDIEGLEDLNLVDHTSNIDMEKKKSWFKDSVEALLSNWRDGRILVKGTFYSIDDIYWTMIVQDSKELIGYQEPEITQYLKPEGHWTIYYRSGIENGHSIFPEMFPDKKYEDMEKDPDKKWFLQTQMYNLPTKSGLAQFANMPERIATISYNEYIHDYEIHIEGDPNFDEPEETWSLRECDVVGAIDPASTEKGHKSTHSRTAIELWAKTPSGMFVLIWARVGYFNILKIFDYLFEAGSAYDYAARYIVVETNAFQKVLKPLLDRETILRDQYIYFKPLSVYQDKDVRIRNTIGLYLQKRKIAIVLAYGKEFREERKIYPQSEYKKDALDCAEKCIRELKDPLTIEEQIEEELEETQRAFACDPITGY